jgi:hypothetical protein
VSRSGYDDCIDGWDLIRWRGAVASAIRGHRGQALLREMLAALDAMEPKRLVDNDLVTEAGEVCALGAVAKARGLDVATVDPEDRDEVAALFGIAPALACEIAFENDEHTHYHRDADGKWRTETPEERFTRVRAWVAAQIREPLS